MERFRGHLNGDNPKQIDTVLAQVSFENGVENYSSVQQNNRERPSLDSIPGAWSEGEFGTLLRRQGRCSPHRTLTEQTTSDQNKQAAVLYSLNVSGEDSPWNLIVGNKKYRVPFRTDVLVGQATDASFISPGHRQPCRLTSGSPKCSGGVALETSTVGRERMATPVTGEYSILYHQANRREWNEISFANYHHYTASSVMHF